MIIRKMTATFGTLDQASLELEPGLNILQAPNEAGKSTWCAFLRVMLYGLKTQERDKSGYLADKTRYRPWSGAPMSGSIDLRYAGQEITLHRRGKGASPMKDFSAVYSGTGEPVPGLEGDSAGEILTGVSEKVFARSAFIRQAGLGVDRSAELEQRIAALVSTGEEDGLSYGEAEARLRQWQRKRYVNRANGRIAQLDKQIEDVQAALQRQSQAGQAQAALQAEVEALRGTLQQLHREQKALDTARRAALAREREAQLRRVERLRRDKMQLEAELSPAGSLLEKTEVQSARQACAAFQAAQVERASLQAGKERADQELAAAQQRLSGSPYRGKPASEARAQAAEQLRLYKGAAAVKPYAPKTFRLGYILLEVLTALCAGTAVLKFGESPWYPLAFSIGLASLASLLLLYLSGVDRKRKQASAMAEMQKILAKAGAAGPEQLLQGAEDYAQDLDALEKKAAAAAGAAGALEQKTEENVRLQERLQTVLAPLGGDCGDIPGAMARLDQWDSSLDALYALELNLAGEERLLAQMPPQTQAAEEADSAVLPRYSAEETAQRMAQADARLRELEKALSAAQGEARALGDPVVLGAELLRLEAERDQQSRQLAAISAALEELEAADTQLRTRFSPALSRRAGEIAEELTAGRYKGLYFDRDWHAQACLAAEAAPRDSLYLSAGAWDQRYLPLRLAI